ncbi:MAG: hypothetical protein H7Y41_07770 [Hyphomonadaceae bacterium]|nr:hypothetical protein [Clostridia bacterium]
MKKMKKVLSLLLTSMMMLNVLPFSPTAYATTIEVADLTNKFDVEASSPLINYGVLSKGDLDLAGSTVSNDNYFGIKSGTLKLGIRSGSNAKYYVNSDVAIVGDQTKSTIQTYGTPATTATFPSLRSVKPFVPQDTTLSDDLTLYNTSTIVLNNRSNYYNRVLNNVTLRSGATLQIDVSQMTTDDFAIVYIDKLNLPDTGSKSITVIGAKKVYLVVRQINVSAVKPNFNIALDKIVTLVDQVNYTDSTTIFAKLTGKFAFSSDVTLKTTRIDAVAYMPNKNLAFTNTVFKGSFICNQFQYIGTTGDAWDGATYADNFTVLDDWLEDEIVATPSPTAVPTAIPTAAPTGAPTATPASTSTPTAQPTTEPTAIPGLLPGLYTEYYDAEQPTKETYKRLMTIEPNVNHNWLTTQTPDETIELKTFSARWTGFIVPQTTGDYTFSLYSDDGIRLWVDGQQLVDRWGLVSFDFTKSTQSIYLEAGKKYPIKLEYQQMPIYAACILLWESDSTPRQIVPPEVCFYQPPVALGRVNTTRGTGDGLKASYYTGKDGLNNGSDLILTTVEPILDQEGFEHVAAIVPKQNFSAVWEGYIEGKYTEDLQLTVAADDGVRVYFDDALVIDQWHPNSNVSYSATVSMVNKKFHKVRVEYYQGIFSATCQLLWSSEGIGEGGIIPQKYLYSQLP